MLALEQRFFLAEHNLNYTDKMSMAVGVEVVLFWSGFVISRRVFLLNLNNEVRESGFKKPWSLIYQKRQFTVRSSIWKKKFWDSGCDMKWKISRTTCWVNRAFVIVACSNLWKCKGQFQIVKIDASPSIFNDVHWVMVQTFYWSEWIRSTNFSRNHRMTNKQKTLKKQVHDFWNEAACGENHIFRVQTLTVMNPI